MACGTMDTSALRGAMAHLVPSAVTLDLFAPTPRRIPHIWEIGAGAYLDAEDYPQDDVDMLVEPLREQALRQFVLWADEHPESRTVVRTDMMMLDHKGLHLHAAFMQPDLTVVTQLAAVSRQWYGAALSLTAGRPLLRGWQACRVFGRLSLDISVHLSPHPAFPFSTECISIAAEHCGFLPLMLVRPPLGLFGQVSSTD